VGVEVGVEIAAQNNYDIELDLSILYLFIYYDDEDVRVIIIIRIITADVSDFQILSCRPRGTAATFCFKN
jgi:hypothetical protein